MNLLRTLNHFWHKPESKPIHNDRPGELSQLKDLWILRAQSYPCDKCNIESKSCSKLVFYDRTICVCPGRDMAKFRKTRKH